jgi:hypothetical protein
LVADERTELAALETELAPELAALETDDALALALEAAPPAEEEAEEAEEAGAEVEPPVAVEEGRLLLVSGILNFHYMTGGGNVRGGRGRVAGGGHCSGGDGGGVCLETRVRATGLNDNRARVLGVSLRIDDSGHQLMVDMTMMTTHKLTGR